MTLKDSTSTLSDQEKLALAQSFLNALRIKDWNLLRSLITDDSTWTLPGTSLISGEAIGADAVVLRAQLIVSYGVSLELKHILYGLHNVTLAIHNQATRGDLVLDEHLATVCILRNGKIAAIDTYLSDVDGVNAFFIPLN